MSGVPVRALGVKGEASGCRQHNVLNHPRFDQRFNHELEIQVVHTTLVTIIPDSIINPPFEKTVDVNDNYSAQEDSVVPNSQVDTAVQAEDGHQLGEEGDGPNQEAAIVIYLVDKFPPPVCFFARKFRKFVD